MTITEMRSQVLEMFRPPREMTVSRWADENVILPGSNSSEPGPWDTDRAPYQREIMDAFSDPNVRQIVVMSSAQVGKTAMFLNMMGYCIDVDPGPIMIAQPKVQAAQDFSKERIAPMIDNCPTLKEKVSDAKSRDGGNTIQTKSFPGGLLAVVSATSPKDLRSRPIRYLMMDEVDTFPKSAGSEGDPVRLAIKRTDTFTDNKKIVLCSTPTIKEASRINKAYQEGTQEEWCVKCPHCEEYSYINFVDIRFEKSCEIVGGKKQYTISNARWCCPNCREETKEHLVKRQPGKWIARNKKALAKGVRSFRMNAFISPWPSWNDLCLQFMESYDDPEELQVFYNTVLGEPWELRSSTSKPEELFDRREWYSAEVPQGVLALTCGVDTQDNRLEYEVVGWSRTEESWGIQKGVILGIPSQEKVWEELDAVIGREWQHASGKPMRIGVTLVDSGGHFTQDVYKQCRKRYSQKVFAIKGVDGDDKQYVQFSKRKELLLTIAVDSGKAAIMSAVAVEPPEAEGQPKPRCCHWPKDENRNYDLQYFQGLLSERQVITTTKGRNKTHWEKLPGVNNEPLDCRNYARAGFKGFVWNFDLIEKTLCGERKKQPTKKKRPSGRVLSKGVE